MDQASELMRSAADLAHRTLGDEHRWTLQLRYYLGTDLLRTGCYSESATLLEDTSKDAFRVYGERDLEAAQYLASHSVALMKLGANGDAEKGFRRCLEILGGTDGKLTRSASGILRNLIALLGKQQLEEQARPFAERMLELRRIEAVRPDASAWQLNCYARELLNVYPQDLRDPALALEIALQGSERSSLKYHYNRYTIALAYEANGAIEQAIEFAELALAYSPSEDSWERTDYERLLVRLYQKHGEPEAAENVFRSVLSARREQFGNFHEDVATALFGLGRVLVDNGNHSEAEEAFRESLAIRETALESPELLSCPVTMVCGTIETLAALSELLETQGWPQEAQALHSRESILQAQGQSCPPTLLR